VGDRKQFGTIRAECKPVRNDLYTEFVGVAAIGFRAEGRRRIAELVNAEVVVNVPRDPRRKDAALRR
jgi:hypothetical protein